MLWTQLFQNEPPLSRLGALGRAAFTSGFGQLEQIEAPVVRQAAGVLRNGGGKKAGPILADRNDADLQATLSRGASVQRPSRS